jgi:putative holliday junction resolvase
MLDYSHYPRFTLFKGQTLLGIDFGSKVIGTALFTPGRDPYPLMAEKIIVKTQTKSLQELSQLILNEDVKIIVYGVPFFVDGKSSENTIKTRQWGEELKAMHPNLQFFEQDETLTTKAAEERMKNSPQFNFKVDVTQIDCVAATIILEDFIRG